MNDWEKYFIARSRLRGRAEYNIADGGEGLSPENAQALYLREGYRIRVSILLKKRWQDPAYRAKLRTIRKNGGFLRPKTSDITRHNQSKAAKLVSHERFNKKVICVETEEIFSSLKEAARMVGVNRECIAAACKGKQKRAASLHWRFVMEAVE